jgi:excisionase family DNA binding protein
MSKVTEPWLSTVQATDHLKITDRTLRNLCKNGKLKYVQPGKKLLFRKSWLDAYALGFGKRLTPSERRELEELL